ncbi:MAG: PSD1 and planctomycete cytochrome C domain-containing protein [Coraliomargaritaceae bacterium]
MPSAVSFNEHIRPIFTKNCAACHGGVKKSGGLSYVFPEEAIAIGLSGKPSIVPGDPDGSYLMEKVTSTDPQIRMPPPEHGDRLKDREIALLHKWIQQGAVWEQHWAFSQVPAVEIPKVSNNQPITPIDSFILRRLEEEGLQPNQEAERGTLFRRVSLDLTGIPPSEDALEQHLADTSPDAYEKAVDRLLASPRYGERWATLWLDLARYADSRGAGKDQQRTIYKFRDWVIRAFNEDMPFDQFTIKQIAGDLLPHPTYDDYIATAFHRNTETEDEGGTNDEEFRVAAVMDRVSTTWQVWHGTTFSCVQCHSHPYDPFRQEEYYQFAAFFNNTQDADTNQDWPLIAFPREETKQVELKDLLSEKEKAQESNWQRSHKLAKSTDWMWLNGLSVTTNEDDQLRYNIQKREGREEYVFEGTPVWNAMTVLAEVEPTENPLQAIRLDVAPLDLEKAPYQPSIGFEINKLKIIHISGSDQKEKSIAYDRVYLDEPFPFKSANPKENIPGFAAWTRIFHTRYAVLRLSDPLVLEAGDKLKFVIEQGNIGGGKLMIVRRGSFAITSDTAWRTLENEEKWMANSERAKKANAAISKIPKVNIPVMRERPENLQRGTKVFIRGNWTTLGNEVRAGTPASLHPMPESDEPNRLRMARWLVDEKNPLTARVLVCRIWEQLFGTGLVETLEDFGSIGALPSHPELLDYLANKLVHEYDWSVKTLIREIVLSAAYRQSSRTTEELALRDPKNRLLARGPRNRMTGEMIRDQVMALSGKLVDTMYGKPVKPPLPEGGWSPSHVAAGNYIADTDENIYRRSIYVHWQQSSPYPFFAAYDAPSRGVCTDRRISSNTPVQPLMSLNDPALFEASQAFGQRMMQYEGNTTEKITYGYYLATANRISQEVLHELVQLYKEIVALYPLEEEGIKAEYEKALNRELWERREHLKRERKRIVDRSKRLEKELPENLPDPDSVKRGPEHAFAYNAEQAAFDTVANVILNLDEVLTK